MEDEHRWWSRYELEINIGLFILCILMLLIGLLGANELLTGGGFWVRSSSAPTPSMPMCAAPGEIEALPDKEATLLVAPAGRKQR